MPMPIQRFPISDIFSFALCIACSAVGYGDGAPYVCDPLSRWLKISRFRGLGTKKMTDFRRVAPERRSPEDPFKKTSGSFKRIPGSF